MTTTMRRLFQIPLPSLFILCLLSSGLCSSLAASEMASDEVPQDTLFSCPMTPQNFVKPPVNVRPWVYYWCLKGHISKDQVTHDLEEMAAKGIGGLLVVDSRGYCDDYDSVDDVPVPLYIDHEFMSDGWRDVMKHLVSEADRLGLKVSFNISQSGGGLRGPWDMKDEGPHELIWSQCVVTGPTVVTIDVPNPENISFFRDVSLIAVRLTCPGTSMKSTLSLSDPWTGVTLPEKDSAMWDQMVSLSSPVKDGKLEWSVPDGTWKIIRFGMRRTGDSICVDILNADTIKHYFQMMPGTLLNDVGPLAGKTLTHFYNVSWEDVTPNWTSGFEEFFFKMRQYDIFSYLPVLTGLLPKEGYDVAERFVDDYFKTISDAFRKNCYETIGKLCHEHGIQWHSENGGPWNIESALFREGDMLSFWGTNDMPQGEFWAHPGYSYDTTNVPYVAMASHIYGKPVTAVEAFTRMSYHWTVYPALLKPYADFNFALGANLFIWHTFTASPPELGKPGFEYFAGSHINTNVTWWPWVGPFMDYLARCQLLLRQGHYVADICVWVSDENKVNWGPAKSWNPESDLIPPPGYRFDLLDSYSLVNRLEFHNGCFWLPDGTSYRLLVFDPLEDHVPLAVIKKLQSFVDQGAPVILGRKKPVAATGLTDWQNADRSVAEIAKLLWSNPVLTGSKTMEDILLRLAILPDAEGTFSFLHRQTESADIYFVVGEGYGEMLFRVRDKKAEIWNAVDGTITPIKSVQTQDGRSKVELNLEEHGSTLVVFTEDKSQEDSRNVAEKTQERKELQTLQGPWQVAFDPQWGGPEQVMMDHLSLWNENENPGIRFYSGTAVYSIDFELSDLDSPLILSLGEVHDIAEVRVNNHSVGTVWTAPWEIEISKAVVPGKNHLDILVTNCWSNRLIGDAGLPPDQRLTKTNVVLEKENDKMNCWRGYTSKIPLMPSGLVGPVTIQIVAP